MADGITYGIIFPFRQSIKGKYFSLSEETDDEIRSNLIHLLFMYTTRLYRLSCS